MKLFLVQNVIDVSTPAVWCMRAIWWGCTCFFAGRSVGKTIDIQYREPEGKPVFVVIPEKLKWMFHFRFYTGNDVLKEGLIVHILGYVFSALELCLCPFILCYGTTSFFTVLTDWLLILFAVVVVLGVLTPMGIRYERNMQLAYDCDVITRIQEVLTLFPVRRCKIISQVNFDTYAITLGRWGRKKRLAKSVIPVVIGAQLFALHSNEHGSPFWTIRDHP